MRFLLVPFTFILLALNLSSCIGTIKDANNETTIAAESNDIANVNYPGITGAVAISSNKVEITFPQSELDADDIAYVVRYDGLQVPTYLYGTALRPDYRGQLRYTVQDLRIDSTYSMSVQVRNVKTGVESNNTVLKQVKTFSNLTANFNGITELRNISGSAGTTAVQAFWNPADTKGSIINKDEIDPIEYVVTLVDGTLLNPGSMNDSAFSDPTRKVISASSDRRSVVIGGLLPGKKYFVQVRAIHYGFSLYSADVNYLNERNTKYLQISTYSEDLGDIHFDDSSFSLNLPPGSAGLYSLNASWAAPTGNFDHYRLYYGIHGSSDVANYLNTQNGDIVCNESEVADSSISCIPLSSSSNLNNLITGLSINTNYDVILAICISSQCEIGKRVVSSVFSKITTPNVADFQGIKTIDPAKSLANLDQVYLNFDLPNFLSGNISGYVLLYYGTDPANASPLSVNDSDIINNTNLNVLPYDYQRDTSIVISGIDPLSIDQYCFKLAPFSYNFDGSKTFGDISNVSAKCITPLLKAPDKNIFPGIDTDVSTCDLLGLSATIKWSIPASGIYSNFELFYFNYPNGQIPPPSFAFGNAIDWNNNSYERILTNSMVNNYKITGLHPGTTYRFGVLTFYSSIDGPIRSEYNSNILECSF